MSDGFPARAAAAATVVFLVSVRLAQAAEPQAPAYPWPRLDQLIEQSEGIRKEADPVVDRLKALRKLYPDSSDRQKMLSERAMLRARLGELTRECEDIVEDYRSTQKFIHVTALTKGMQTSMRGSDAGKTSQVLMRIMHYDEAMQRIKKSLLHYYKEAADDDQGLAQMQEKLAKESDARMFIGIAAVSIVLAMGLSFWITRGKSDALPTLEARPYEEAPKLTAGPGLLPAARPKELPLEARKEIPRMLGGNYRILKEIGRGGMGVVYAATDETLRRDVAIKRMRGEVVQSEKELEQFLSEARLVASLKHPCLVEIYSIHREGGEIYLIFEFVDGWTLHQWIERKKTIPVQEANFVLRRIASALDYAHSRKVIHRDLKPSNIMLAANGVVKVMDFGIAYQAKMTAARMTRADAWGTPPYMAPEQELGSVARESDIFSLGVCYYEMLTGKLPFSGPNYLAQKRESRYLLPSECVPRLPDGIDAIVRKALSPDVADRYHSGAEFARAVEALPAPKPADS